MTRYHFHLENDVGAVDDEEGRELANDEAAIAEAGRALGMTMAEDIGHQRATGTITVRIVRADGTRVATVAATSTLDRA